MKIPRGMTQMFYLSKPSTSKQPPQSFRAPTAAATGAANKDEGSKHSSASSKSEEGHKFSAGAKLMITNAATKVLMARCDDKPHQELIVYNGFQMSRKEYLQVLLREYSTSASEHSSDSSGAIGIERLLENIEDKSSDSKDSTDQDDEEVKNPEVAEPIEEKDGEDEGSASDNSLLKWLKR